MVFSYRGDGAWRLAASMARRLISLPEAAGTPEGGKVLGRGSAPMDSRLVRMTQSRLPVSSLLKCTGVLCRCRRRKAESFLPHLAAVTRGDASRHKGKDDLPGGTRDVHNKAPMQKKCQWEMPRRARLRENN